MFLLIAHAFDQRQLVKIEVEWNAKWMLAKSLMNKKKPIDFFWWFLLLQNDRYQTEKKHQRI